MKPNTTGRPRSTSVSLFNSCAVPLERCQHLVVDLDELPAIDPPKEAAVEQPRLKRRLIKARDQIL